VVADVADDIAVMYAGRIVEKSPTRALFTETRHPYTKALFQSIPKLSQASHTRLEAISGRPPDLVTPPIGCKFAARCPHAQPKCIDEEPPLIDAETSGHAYRCWFPAGTPAGEDAKRRNLEAGETATGLKVAERDGVLISGMV